MKIGLEKLSGKLSSKCLIKAQSQKSSKKKISKLSFSLCIQWKNQL
jgi:hypothetical protein